MYMNFLVGKKSETSNFNYLADLDTFMNHKECRLSGSRQNFLPKKDPSHSSHMFFSGANC